MGELGLFHVVNVLQNLELKKVVTTIKVHKNEQRRS